MRADVSTAKAVHWLAQRSITSSRGAGRRAPPGGNGDSRPARAWRQRASHRWGLFRERASRGAAASRRAAKGVQMARGGGGGGRPLEELAALDDAALKELFEEAPLCGFVDWLRYRKEQRPRGVREFAGDGRRRESQLWRRVMRLVHGEQWAEELAAASAAESTQRR